MNRVAIAFSTKDRTELSKQSIEPLLQPDKFDLLWIDGSDTEAGQDLPLGYSISKGGIFSNVRGGADAAIVFSLTALLAHPAHYDYVGLVENDVLLEKDWFEATFALFDQGQQEGLEVGAVSARSYEDRVLCRRDGYALMHNLGAGMVIFTRKAAELVLINFRTGWWTENRRTFIQLCGLDIGKWGAFRTNEQWVTADWHFEKTLANFGLAALALTPSKCQMIGQIPPLAEQGLKLVTGSGDILPNAEAFKMFAERTEAIRDGELLLSPNPTAFHQPPDGSWMIFPHQIAEIGGKYTGDWRLKWSQGYGPFAWKAGDGGEYPFMHTPPLSATPELQMPTLTVSVSGACSFLVSGGERGGKIQVEDIASGYQVCPEVPPEKQMTQLLNLVVPGNFTHREIRLTMLTPGTIFYGLSTREPQATLPQVAFDHSRLPPI